MAQSLCLRRTRVPVSTAIKIMQSRGYIYIGSELVRTSGLDLNHRRWYDSTRYYRFETPRGNVISWTTNTLKNQCS
jgi:hypothetical protein